MYKVGINFDEISDDLDTAIRIMESCNTSYGELRTLNKKNFVFWTDEEVSNFKSKIAEENIELVAATTPLFKWYVNPDEEEIVHDSFGFNPRLNEEAKREVIKRTFAIASALSIPRLRIFSGLGKADRPGALFAKDPLLALCLELAEQYAIDIYIENEPVCKVYTEEHIVELLDQEPHPRLKLWLDVANLVELGDQVDEAFLRQVASRLGYVHVKDFVIKNGQKHYVPVGEGQIDYPRILRDIHRTAARDLIFTVETHAKENKIDASTKSLRATKELVDAL